MLSQKAKDFTISYLNDVYPNNFLPQQINILKKVSILQVETFDAYALRIRDQINTFIEKNNFEDGTDLKLQLLNYIKELPKSFILTTDKAYNDFILNIYFLSFLHNMTSFCNMLLNYEEELS